MSRIENYIENTVKSSRNEAAMAYLAALDHIESVSPDIARGISRELTDQRSYLKLIASENFCSLAVQLAMGNLLTDKYAEGFSHHRFYAGCGNVDSVEDLATNELIKIFNCEAAYAQPHSGADANLLAFWAVLSHRVQDKEIEKIGKKNLNELTQEEHEKIRQVMMNQKIMGMSLNSGGHLTHGFIQNLSSKMFQSVPYDVDPKTELLDYGKLAEQVKKEKPLILIAGYSAYPRKINFAKMREIADSVGATLLVDMAHFSGLVAGKVFTGEFDPVPYAHIVTSTTHKTLRGPRGGIVLCKEEFKEIINKGCPLVMGGPLPHVMAAKAIAFQEANTPDFQKYSQNIVDNAACLVDALKSKGVRLVSDGTENHLFIADLTKFGLTGRHAETALRKAGLTVNRNAIPFDKNGAWYTSGIRIGTPAITTLGMGTAEMKEIADIIVETLEHTSPTIVEKTGKPSLANAKTGEAVLEKSRCRIKELLEQFPLYPEIPLNQTM